jgi:hypothetical protein
MLDLDTLASLKAKSLNQKEDVWKKAVWSSDFQRISQGMSDGEVESFLSICPSVAHLETAVKRLDKLCSEKKEPPFTVLMSESEKAGVSPEQWIRSSLSTGSA